MLIIIFPQSKSFSKLMHNVYVFRFLNQLKYFFLQNKIKVIQEIKKEIKKFTSILKLKIKLIVNIHLDF